MEQTTVANHTCAAFLRIMREFSESSCDASETVARVDSLAHQDQHLFKLLPITPAYDPPAKRLKRSESKEDAASEAPTDTSDSGDLPDELRQWIEMDAELDPPNNMDMLHDEFNVFDFAQFHSTTESTSSVSESNASSTDLKDMDMQPLSQSETIDESVRNSQSDTDHEDTAVWGKVDEPYEQNLLSSIDHTVLCDRESRFLQWDLDTEPPSQHSVTSPTHSSISSTSSGSTVANNFAGLSMFSNSGSYESGNAELFSDSDSWVSSVHGKSPSHVDAAILDDWSSLDFGTFQNRTVSHILCSRLHKRKFQYPYKHQVKLVNFDIPQQDMNGASTRLPKPRSDSMSGSLASSITYGGASDLDSYLSQYNNGGVSPSALFNTTIVSATEASQLKSMMSKSSRKSKKNEKKVEADEEKKIKDKPENMPLPEVENMPEDLQTLKDSIEATERIVEETKHRHRKGGPCPRCYMQNKLRAAKRDYYKRAMQHRKNPQAYAQSPFTVGTPLETLAARMCGTPGGSNKKKGGDSKKKSALVVSVSNVKSEKTNVSAYSSSSDKCVDASRQLPVTSA